MMTGVVMCLALFGALFGQILVPPLAVLGFEKPPLLLGVVIYYSMNHSLPAALSAAVAAGFLQDAFSAVPLGYSSVIFCGVALSIGAYRGTLLSEAMVTQAFFGAVGAVAMTVVLYGLLWKEGLVRLPPAVWVGKAIGSGVLGGGCTPLVCAGLTGLDRFAGNILRRDIQVKTYGLGETLR